MINNRAELIFYLNADRDRNPKISVKKMILQDEDVMIVKLIESLRMYEYFRNTCNTSLSVRSLLKFYWLIKFRRLQKKTNIFISPNTVGPGLYLNDIPNNTTVAGVPARNIK